MPLFLDPTIALNNRQNSTAFSLVDFYNVGSGVLVNSNALVDA
jgi:hypothetical protein